MTDIDKFKALFLLADIPVLNTHELSNDYWPDCYSEQHPWALMMTPYGAIKIGWRKRVISISWTDTSLRKQITTDNVTNELDLVHAWSYNKALEYLQNLRVELKKVKDRAEIEGRE